MSPKLFAIFAAGLLLVAGLAPAVAAEDDLSVSANQPAPGDEVTVTVTHDGAAAENASVDVNATDGEYAGEGNHTTDENGTVVLPAPEENVTVEITAEHDNATATITVELLADEEEADAFGQLVSAFVHSLLNGTEEERRIGRMIADWVVANNPGNAPDHAGPPDDAGPPSFAGPSGDDAAGNETSGNATVQSGPGNGGPGNGDGPPEDRGPDG